METATSAPAASAVPKISHTVIFQYEELDRAAYIAEDMIQVLTNPVIPQLGDDEIQLEETEGAEDAMQTETT